MNDGPHTSLFFFMFFPYEKNISGQIIVTSHDLGPQNVAEERKWEPLFQENLGW